MRRSIAAGFFAGGLLLIGIGGASGQTWGQGETPRSGACFYEHPNFGGRHFCAAVGASSRMVPENMNDKISSIRIFGDAGVTVFKDRDFRGDTRHFGRDKNDLREVGWNDRISSFRVEERRDRDEREGRGGAYGEGEGNRELSWGRPEAPRSGACFYENPNFEGRYFCAAIGDATGMVPEGMNDRISSIRIFGEAEVSVFKDRDFRGEARAFGRDMRDLRAAGFNDRITSFRVSARGSFHRRH
jgi:hypothetical protein